MSNTIKKDKNVSDFALLLDSWVQKSPVIALEKSKDNPELNIAECRYDHDTGRFSMKRKSGSYRSVSVDQIAEKFADATNPNKEKWSFGEWMGVIFSFGLWKPKGSPKLQRERDYAKWTVIDALKKSGKISEATYEKQRNKYKTVSTLRGKELVDYLHTGELPVSAEERDKQIAQLLNSDKIETTAKAKVTYGHIKEKIRNAVDSHNVRYKHSNKKNYMSLVSLSNNICSRLDLIPQVDSKKGKQYLFTAGYVAGLADDPEKFHDFADTMEKFNQFIENSKLDIPKTFGEGATELSVMFDVILTAALLPKDTFARPYALVADMIKKDPALFQELCHSDSPAKVLENHGIRKETDLQKTDNDFVKV